MRLSKVIRKKKEEIRWLLSKNKIADVLLCLANDRSPDIVKYHKLNANWHTKCETYCMRKWLFIFRGIWNPIEASFGMLCYVPVGTRMSITVHACVHVHVWQLPAQPPVWMSAGWWSQVSCLQGEILIVVSIHGQPSTLILKEIIPGDKWIFLLLYYWFV